MRSTNIAEGTSDIGPNMYFHLAKVKKKALHVEGLLPAPSKTNKTYLDTINFKDWTFPLFLKIS